MDAVGELAQLSLVSRVCTELENNCGINDPTLGKHRSVFFLVNRLPTCHLSLKGLAASCLLIAVRSVFVVQIDRPGMCVVLLECWEVAARTHSEACQFATPSNLRSLTAHCRVPTAAEFIIDIADKSGNELAFSQTLGEAGAEFAVSLSWQVLCCKDEVVPRARRVHLHDSVVLGLFVW